MNIEFKIAQLETPEDWTGLTDLLGGSSPVANSIIRHLRAVHVRSYLLETRYIDRDYSADYRRFYAQTFKTYDRHCQRVHFFAEDIAPIINNPVWLKRLEALQATSRRSYRGFCVIRPLPGAPIGRTVLYAIGLAQPGLESVVTCRADVRANLLGAELDVVGTSFMQQDSRLGACAQIAIWVGARHMHQRYKYDWLSVADITRLAAPTTPQEATSIPAGSDFLTSERMIRAINEMGFQPLCFDGPDIGAKILPYVESGLPVILGMQEGTAGLGHAVAIIGRVFARLKTPSNQALEYVPAFIAHDDQAGPYMLVPTTASSAKTHSLNPAQLIVHALHGKSINFNVEDHGVFAVTLMPLRAFSTAREAEKTSLSRLSAVLQSVDKLRLNLSRMKAPMNDRLLKELGEANKNKKIVLRTYLTSASGYRRHIALGTACDQLKDVLLRMHLPHFMWVTEIATVDSYNQASAGFRRIYGHTVLDATSTGKDTAGLLMLHVPGMVFLRNVDAKPGEQAETGIVIENDALYECREKRPTH